MPKIKEITTLFVLLHNTNALLYYFLGCPKVVLLNYRGHKGGHFYCVLGIKGCIITVLGSEGALLLCRGTIVGIITRWGTERSTIILLGL